MIVSNWKVLSVDDDPAVHGSLEKILSSRMGDHVFEFTKANSFDEGIACIKSSRFDLIFLDVHEEGSDSDPENQPSEEDQRGEELLGKLKMERFVPVVFYTGFPAKVRHLESPVVQVVDKGASIDEIRNAVNLVLSTKLPQLSRYIEEQSREYIWNSLDDVFKTQGSIFNSPDLALLMARNLARNLSQQVIKQLLEVDVNVINPIELYQYPPIEKTCNPADIYRKKDDKSLWMVLTPACDFEQGKVENVLLAKIIPIEDHELYEGWLKEYSNFKDLDEESQKRKEFKKPLNAAAGEVKSLIKDRKAARYKFLPGTFFLPDCVVDFQDLVNCPKDYEGSYDVVCSLDSSHP